MASLEAQLQAGTRQFQKIQSEYSKAVEHRQRLDAQNSESQAVDKEFSTLPPTARIFKQLGPVLLPQEHDEAKANVQKRLQFIQGEITRLETSLSTLDASMESKKLELVHLQTQIQQQRQTTDSAVAAP